MVSIYYDTLLYITFYVSILLDDGVHLFIITAVSKDGETVMQNDMTYSLRHVEESWIHLLKAGKSTIVNT